MVGERARRRAVSDVRRESAEPSIDQQDAAEPWGTAQFVESMRWAAWVARDHIAPLTFVKIHSKERAGLVLQHRIDTDHVTAHEMVVDGLLDDWEERLVGALATLHARLLTYVTPPLVGTSGRIAPRPLLGVDPARWVNIRATME